MDSEVEGEEAGEVEEAEEGEAAEGEEGIAGEVEVVAGKLFPIRLRMHHFVYCLLSLASPLRVQLKMFSIQSDSRVHLNNLMIQGRIYVELRHFCCRSF